MTKITRATRLDRGDDDRLVVLAKREQRTVSQMMRILLVEAMNHRECSDIIRQAEGRQETTQEFMAEMEKRGFE